MLATAGDKGRFGDTGMSSRIVSSLSLTSSASEGDEHVRGDDGLKQWLDSESDSSGDERN